MDWSGCGFGSCSSCPSRIFLRSGLAVHTWIWEALTPKSICGGYERRSCCWDWEVTLLLSRQPEWFVATLRSGLKVHKCDPTQRTHMTEGSVVIAWCYTSKWIQIWITCLSSCDTSWRVLSCTSEHTTPSPTSLSSVRLFSSPWIVWCYLVMCLIMHNVCFCCAINKHVWKRNRCGGFFITL